MNAILAIAKTTIGEAVRRRILLVILLIGILFLVVAPSLNMLTARQETTVLKSLTLGVADLTGDRRPSSPTYDEISNDRVNSTYPFGGLSRPTTCTW